MKRRFRYRLLTLILAVPIAAISFAFILPFHPKVSFAVVTEDRCDEVNVDPLWVFEGDPPPLIYVEVTNNSFWPIWYRASNRLFSWTEWVWEPLPSEGGHYMTGSLPIEWSMMMPGSSAFNCIQADPSQDEVKLAAELQDWRGRSKTCWSDVLSVVVSNADSRNNAMHDESPSRGY
ncbi:hypothetical protein Mal15_12130 [Stieleria maiorica]|uniref:Uncharacterized protein n=1 Tax=Stieleria maiorica TaxID=2795974 RepID=A0A5B9MC86_9BACT|nr:hypothetical protein Mal15_12130 [Stieleria maiorica]